jgi:hypothetical protein
MRWAVEFTLATGTIGLIIFSAEDESAARAYVTEMCTKYGHTNVTNLCALPRNATVPDLFRLYQNLTCLRKNAQRG